MKSIPLPLAGPGAVVDQVAELLAFAVGKLLAAHEVRQQRGERAATKGLGHVLKASTNQFVAIEQGGKKVGSAGAVATDEPLFFEALQELLDGRVFRSVPAGIDGVAKLLDGAWTLLPEDLEQFEFLASHIARCSGHDVPRHSDILTERDNKAECLRSQEGSGENQVLHPACVPG